MSSLLFIRMATPKRKPGRPPKHMGLSTPMRRLVDDDSLQDLRQETPQSEEPVLLPARGGNPPEAGSLRVFGTADDHHVGGRNRKPVESTVSYRAGQTVSPDTDLRISPLLKRIMAETAADEFQDDGTRMTNLEVLVRKLVDRALNENQFAMETVLDRFEGKPVRANQVQVADTALEEQIDRASVDALNSLLEPPKP